MNFLGRDCVLRFLCDLPFAFLVASPRPLDLDGGDMVHGESMIFEKSSSQRHFIGGLDQTGAEVSQASVFILDHHVEGGCQELLAETLSR